MVYTFYRDSEMQCLNRSTCNILFLHMHVPKENEITCDIKVEGGCEMYKTLQTSNS